MGFIRVYNNGNMKEDYPLDSDEWLEFNKTTRFGVALFIDSKCYYEGYLGKERCKEISKQLKKENR